MSYIRYYRAQGLLHIYQVRRLAPNHPPRLFEMVSPRPAVTKPTPGLNLKDKSIPSEGSAGPSSPPAHIVQGTAAFSPLYQQIKGLILNSLQAGEWKPGEAIPSEMDLAVRFRVSQGTVRKAIDELAASNMVTRRQGKGTFVSTHAEQRVQYRFLRLIPDTETPTPTPAALAQRTVLECKPARATGDVATALALRAGDPVMQVRRVLSFGGIPTILEDIWLPGEIFKNLVAGQMTDYSGPTYALFELEFGVRMVRAEEKIRAVMPNTRQAKLLHLSAATPLLSVERIAFTYNDAPMELRRGLYCTATHHYRNDLS